jgi:hypothetical protein
LRGRTNGRGQKQHCQQAVGFHFAKQVRLVFTTNRAHIQFSIERAPGESDDMKVGNHRVWMTYGDVTL